VSHIKEHELFIYIKNSPIKTFVNKSKIKATCRK